MTVRRSPASLRAMNPIACAILSMIHSAGQAQVPTASPEATLGSVTVNAVADDRTGEYAPALTRSATKGSAALRDIPQTVNVVPRQLPGCVTADLAGSWRSRRYEVGVNLRHLTDRRYCVSSHGSVDNLILPGAPRELQATLRAKF